MKCPVCNKECNKNVGVSSHLFKTKDEPHHLFIEGQNKIIDEAYDNLIPCETLAEQENCYVSATYICERWKTKPNYKERKSLMNSLSIKKQYKEGTRQLPKNFTNKGYKYNFEHKSTISLEQYNQIIFFFNTDVGIKEVAIMADCNSKTVRRVFVRQFGEQETRKRGKRVSGENCRVSAGGNNKIEIHRPELIPKIIEAFNSDDGIRTLSNKLNVSSGVILRIWGENFNKELYKERVAKMLKLQQEHAAVSIGKARFLGSKNEIMCCNLLSDVYGKEVIHHDFSIVFPLEVDISIPNKKIAISWDGIGHRKPVFGEKAYNKVIKNDIIRDKVLQEKGWRYISVIDNGSYSPDFVSQKVNEIIKLIEEEWSGKKII